MRTLREMWLRLERHYADETATVFDGSRATYAQLVASGRRLAASLAARGVRRQDRVAMLSMNRAEWFEVLVACHLSGVILNTVNFRLAPDELRAVLTDAAPRVLLFEAQYAPSLEAIRAALPSDLVLVGLDAAPSWAERYGDLLGAPVDGGPSGRCAAEVRADDIAHLIYTSGTTGRPKGVMRSHAADLSFAVEMAAAMNLRPGGSMLLMMPLFHIGALGEALAQFCRAGTVHLQRRFDPVEILSAIERERIEATHMVPTMVRDVLDCARFEAFDRSSLRMLCYSAAPMPVTLLRRAIAAFGAILVDIYGGTEMGGVTVLPAHLHVVDGRPAQVERLGSVGHAFPDAELRILDEDGAECPAGVPGEVCVRTASLMSGYWNNDAATIAAIEDGWYRTGDMGRLDAQGFLFLVDRKKDMIISGGENVFCREVEEALMAHGGLADVAVIGIPDPRWGETVRAIAVRRPGGNVTADELIAFAARTIASYKKPGSVVFATELPKLPSGKVSKVTLRALYGG